MAGNRELGMHRRISRRDFLNGISIGASAIGVSGAVTRSPFPQDQDGYYPPALAGLRGSHAGAFDAAHELRDGTFWKQAGAPSGTAEHYDLIVAGGGIGGLAAAHFYRSHHKSARVLILDNHDDFGGHARRNEFHVGGRRLITFGGTLSIESPFPYSPIARGLMDELGINPVRLTTEAEKAAGHPFEGLKSAVFFDRETFGADQLAIGVPGRGDLAAWTEFLAKTPLSPEVQRDIARLENAEADYLPGLSSSEKKDRLSRVSYRDFLLTIVNADPGIIPYYQTSTHDLFGVGIDAVNALDCWALRLPGFAGMKLEPGATHRMGFTARGEATPQPPYHFHFPDGNASIARALTRSLIPGIAPGRTADDVVTAKFNYGALDRDDSPVRIRLGSTVVRVAHRGNPKAAKHVEVFYRRESGLYRVTGGSAVLACWNMMIPYLCPDLPDEQKEALKYGVKVPLVYTAVALRNWWPWRKLGIRRVEAPGMYHSTIQIEDPTTIGDYRESPKSADDPVVARMRRTPCKPGLPEREQHRVGHFDLYTTPFATFERSIREQLGRVLGGGGFDPARDIAAITVNRWPHGYAYEYNYLFDPEWPDGKQPCQIARRRFGRIAIANSDAAAAAYTDQAIDQAYRAVQELLAGS